jgi:DNA processing protein
MDWHLRLLNIQNESWFYTYKDFFCDTMRTQRKLSIVFEKAKDRFPELGRRLEFPLRLPKIPFSYRFITYGDLEYPHCFYYMLDPPLILTVAGESCWLKDSGLSVVGSREPVSESLQWIEDELGSFVEKRKPVLISGGARGVDQTVHALAIRKKVPTVVFLPSGLGEIYPAMLQSWLPRVLETGGCFISEYSLDQRIERRLFHHRNRLIAHLGVATVIVQASGKSGTLMTGHLASEAGKPTWVVPAHPLRRVFQGNLRLLQEGAVMVCSAEDLSLFFAGEESNLSAKTAYLATHSHSIN